uniref:Uncharacterized protein n=1 Tax=Mandrillus leucophaeus TaxID=9568 RepID=A0A2K5YZB9_MANLE
MWAVRTAFGQAGALWRGRSNVGWERLARRAQSALAQLRGILEGELEGIRGAGTWKSERVITSRQGPHIRVDGHPQECRSKNNPLPPAGGCHPLFQLL